MRYRHPSIIEAICEFTFRPEVPWDPTVFGRFYERVKDEFEIKEHGEVIETILDHAAGGLGRQVRKAPRMRFFAKDRSHLTQVSEHLLAVNVLAPYPHWAEFKRLIFLAVKAYDESAGQTRLNRTVLRYIDRFEFDEKPFRMGDWFDCSGRYFPSLLAPVDSQATYRLRFPRSEQEHFSISVEMRTEASGKRTVILDTEIVSFEIQVADRSVEDQLDSMHSAVIDAFENCITDKTREKLQPEQQ
jgi:uncharacterized protein (TIGR04255 family)